MKDAAKAMLDIIEVIFNYMMNLSITLLSKNPQNFAKESGVWETIEGINKQIIPIASALLALFFFIGFCENCIDVKEELNFEMCLKLFIRIGIAEYFVVNSIDIVVALFNLATNLAGISTAEMNIACEGYNIAIDDMEWWQSLIFIIPLLFLFIIAISSATVVLMTVFMRFFKIWIAIPYGTIAFSTISSGSHWLKGTVSAFIKYLLSVLLEAFSLGIGLSIGIKFIFGEQSVLKLSGLISDSDFSAFAGGLIIVADSAISFVMLVMLVRTSQKIAGKVLALDR